MNATWVWVIYSVETRASIDVFTTVDAAMESIALTYPSDKGYRIKVDKRSSLWFVEVEMNYPKGQWSMINEFEIRCHTIYDKAKTL